MPPTKEDIRDFFFKQNNVTTALFQNRELPV